jgi:hypothetical protein
VIERGSNLNGQRIEVTGGKFDGATGIVIDVNWIEGARHVKVLLDCGEEIVTVQPGPEKADTDIPRELGTL